MDFSELIDELIPLGRGTAALKICLDVIANETDKRDIVVPSMTCPSVISVILYCGFDPIFCDVELETLTISENTVSKVITKNTAAILLIYLFGHYVDANSLARYAKINSCYLIEDICQSFGGQVGNKLMGLIGDFTILSFAKGKILITDCSRRNFWGDFGIKSPFAPSIEWNLHQPPSLVKSLFDNDKFSFVLRWSPFKRFGWMGRLISFLGIIPSYFMQSHFNLLINRKSITFIVGEQVGWSLVSEYKIGNIYIERIGELQKRITKISKDNWLAINGRAIKIDEISLEIPT